MSENIKGKVGWKLVGIVVLAIILFMLWHRDSVLSEKINELKEKQSQLIQNQVQLQANAHLLSPSQVKALKEMANSGDFIAMRNLYAYYSGATPKTVQSQSQAFVWGTLALAYSALGKQNDGRIDSLKQKYKDALPSGAFHNAEKEIQSKKRQINANVARLFKTLDDINKATENFLKDPNGRLADVLKKGVREVAENYTDQVVNKLS